MFLCLNMYQELTSLMLNLILTVLNLARSGTRLHRYMLHVFTFTCLRYTWRFFLVLQELPALTVVCSSYL